MKKAISLITLVLLAGCGEPAATDAPTAGGTAVPAPVDGSSFVLDAEPDGAGDVIQIRADAKDGDEIVIVGRIGGSANPWIDGRAAFSIVDRSLRPCNEIPGDKCPIPWDYCCETDKLPTGMVLVKFNDDNGKLLAAGAKDLFGLKELDTVVISGNAKVDEAGNVTVMADGMYVRKSQ